MDKIKKLTKLEFFCLHFVLAPVIVFATLYYLDYYDYGRFIIAFFVILFAFSLFFALVPKGFKAVMAGRERNGTKLFSIVLRLLCVIFLSFIYWIIIMAPFYILLANALPD